MTEATPTISAEPTAPTEVPAGENPAEVKPAEVSALRKLKVKGKEIEVDEAKFIEYAQKGAASTETWQEAAKMRKEYESFMHRLKTNPREVLLDPSLGVDFRKVAEDYLWEQIQDEQLTPEQKAQKARDRELEKYKKQHEEKEKEELTAKQQAQAQHYAQDYDRQISGALAASGLPKTTGTVRRMTEYMIHDVKAGFQRDAAEYVEMVRNDYMQDIKELLGSVEGEHLLKFLGEDGAKKLRTADLSRLKSTTPKEGHTFVPGKGMVGKEKVKKMGGFDWEAAIKKEMLGK